MSRVLEHVVIQVGERQLLGIHSTLATASTSIAVYFHGFPDLSVHPDESKPPEYASRFPRKLEELLPFDLLCVNFSGLPGSDGQVPFHAKCLSREVDDAKGMIDYCSTVLGRKHVHVIGLSTGAILASLIRQYHHPALRSITAIAGIADTMEGVHLDFSAEQQLESKERGFCLCPFYWPTNWPLPRDGVDFDEKTRKLYRPLYHTYIEDMIQLKISESVQNKSIPFLVIHGDQDKNIPFFHGKSLYDSASNPKKWLLIKGGNHLLTNSKHIKKAIIEIHSHILASESRNINDIMNSQ